MTPESQPSVAQQKKVSYTELLRNPPMAVLLFARVLDPVATTSIHSYMFAQLKWLSPHASDIEIAFHAGLLAASKTAAKCLTGLLWGRLSDKPFGGRRLVLLISLFTSVIAALGYGLSRSIVWAIFWQVFGGATSSAIGIIRCMVAELETRPSHRSRALLLLPLAGTVGQLLGPLLGGFLTSVRGPGLLGQYPFFLPNAIIAAAYAISFVACWFVVDETLETFDRKKGSGLQQCFSRLLVVVRRRRHNEPEYAPLAGNDDDQLVLSPQRGSHEEQVEEDMELQTKPDLPFWQIWTPPVIFTMTAHFIIAGHISTFVTSWSVFLASDVASPSEESGSTFFRFTGGTGLTPPEIGTFMSIFALLGIALQTFLPSLNDRFGTVAIWRTALMVFPIAYLIAPYSAFVASNLGKVQAWVMLSVSMLLYVVARTGAAPAMTLLINACVPHPTARGTINVAGTVVGNLSRSIFPIVIMSIYGWGAENRLVVLGFWFMSALALVAIFASLWVKETEVPNRKMTSSSIAQEEEQRR